MPTRDGGVFDLSKLSIDLGVIYNRNIIIL